MVDEVPLQKAVDTAWTVYLATHRDVDAADGRRCCWSVICKERARPTKATLKNSHVRVGVSRPDF